jgi:hypothetical protein
LLSDLAAGAEDGEVGDDADDAVDGSNVGFHENEAVGRF